MVARVVALAFLATTAAAFEPLPDATKATSQALDATGMTYVSSRGSSSGLVLTSRTAIFYPDHDFADLLDVDAVFTDDADGESFEMTCDRAELNVETNDFHAEGNVHGTTSSGETYTAPWVDYDDAAGLLSTDAPVVMVDDTGTFRGIGFEYRVEERTFKLLGNVSVVHSP